MCSRCESEAKAALSAGLQRATPESVAVLPVLIRRKRLAASSGTAEFRFRGASRTVATVLHSSVGIDSPG